MEDAAGGIMSGVGCVMTTKVTRQSLEVCWTCWEGLWRERQGGLQCLILLRGDSRCGQQREGERGQCQRQGPEKAGGLSPSLPGGFFIVQKLFTAHPEHWAGMSALLELSSGADRQQTEK